ncbi:hypothetical protein GARC_1590 [Paraglaciecola arctica BSs20135]|uniref:Uncharacterized protein n=1 Tax=Paraglaciecola arctica BSs20135 TaxID=493475 RepID=K6YK46_9ALTE|nr:hypothetical protein GARC_1590 [Paraglaciecola arctica BSs20135]
MHKGIWDDFVVSAKMKTYNAGNNVSNCQHYSANPRLFR